jgi:hypothetical protein
MNVLQTRTATAFRGDALLAAGPLADVALAVRDADDAMAGILVFEDATGAVIDLDLRGSAAEVTARYAVAAEPPVPPAPAPRGRGRPALGVTAREVTLLPRHWAWLSAQQGGASAALRRLVEAARRGDDGATASRAARDAAYRFMSAMAGDRPGFEEAARALYAGDLEGLGARITAWPPDVRAHAARLAAASAPPAEGPPAFLTPTESAGRALVQRRIDVPVVMLNLLRLRAVADYGASPELAPAAPISGAEALERYVAHTLPHLRASGGELALLGTGGPWLIGPEGERWDRAMLVRQASVAAFMAFAENAAYLAGIGHRTAALEDSRLLPLVEAPLPAGAEA